MRFLLIMPYIEKNFYRNITQKLMQYCTRGLSIDTLCIIGNYYGTTLDYLITGEYKDMQKCFSYLSRLSENQRTKIDNIIVNLIDTLEW